MEEDIKILEEMLNSKEPVCNYILKHQEIEAISNLLTRYKQLEEENVEWRGKWAVEVNRQSYLYVPKSKIKEKIEELKKDLERDRICIDFVIEHTKDIELMAEIKVLQELLEEE